MSYEFTHAALGGTFDHFHIGHQALLTEAFSRSRLVSVGITDDTMVYGKQFPDILEPYVERRKQVTLFLKEKGWFDRVRFHILTDVYGTAAKEKTLDALFVTEEVMKNAELINQKRDENRLPLLPIVSVPLVKGEDGTVVSSTRIRRGEIDREGHSYVSLFDGKDRYFLTDELREELRRPMGFVLKSEKTSPPTPLLGKERGDTTGDVGAGSKPAQQEGDVNGMMDSGSAKLQTLKSKFQIYHFISRRDVFFPIEHPPIARLEFGTIPDPDHGLSYQVKKKVSSPYRDLVEDPAMIITVGDIVSMTLRDEGRQADLEVVDFRTRRRKVPEKDIRRYVVDAKPHLNDAGSIHCQTAMDLFRKVSEHLATGEKQQMVITGEEDLLTIPAILLSPLGTKVVYGQVDAGMVVVTVTEEMKRKVAGILKRFRYGVEL